MSDNKEVSTNEYGIPDAEYDKERQAARNAAMGIEPEEAPPAPEAPQEPEPPVAEEAQAAPAEAEAATAVDAPDPLADFPEDVREKVASLLKAKETESDRLKHKYESDIGRLNAYQRKYEEARREALEKDKQLAALKKTPPKSLKEIAPGPRIKEALETDEVLVETLDELRQQIRKELQEEFSGELEQFRKQVEPLAEHRQREEQDRFTRELDTQVDNWREVVYEVQNGRITVDENGTPVFSQAWATFLNDQPPRVQEAILHPSTPDDALWALNAYNEWGVRKGYIQTQSSESVPNVPNADAIQRKRQEDLKRHAPPKASAMPLGTNTPDDPSDPKWEERMRKLAREAAAKRDPSILLNAR
jgi:hypothetical protein